MNCATSYRIYPLLFLFPLFLPGCGRLIDWGRSTFDQGKQLRDNTEPAKKYMRSTVIYDQFTTSAMFDVLWLSDEVRTIYTDLYIRRSGKGLEQKNNFLRRQLEENNHFITFYVISLYEIPLGDSTAEWSLFLRVNDQTFLPIEVKVVDLCPEYRTLIGERFNRFKVAYSVKFDANDINGNPIIDKDTDVFGIVFRSVDKEAQLVWGVDNNIDNHFINENSFSDDEFLAT